MLTLKILGGVFLKSLKTETSFSPFFTSCVSLSLHLCAFHSAFSLCITSSNLISLYCFPSFLS